MAERKPYTVENQRPRRTVNLFGRILAPKGLGRNSQCDLSERELCSDSCVRLFKVGRLALVRGEMPAALVAALADDEEEVVEEPEVEVAPPPAPEPAPEPEPTPEPEPEPDPEPVVEEPSVEEPPAASGPAHTEESLSELSYSEVQAVAKDMDLKASGKKKAMIARILDAQSGD
jgi:hypothetical protein